MQHGTKGINNLSEIESYCKNSSIFETSLKQFFSACHLNGVTRMLNSVKSKGVEANLLFSILFTLPFININNIYRYMLSPTGHRMDIDDNTLYRFQQNPLIPWRKILFSFFCQYEKSIDMSEDNSPRHLIVDDSNGEKTGKQIEGISRVHNHAGGSSFVLGFKYLVCGLWNGVVFAPLDFSIHSEARKDNSFGLTKKEREKVYTKNRPANSFGQKRFEERLTKKTTMAFNMIHRVFRAKIGFDYVLMDSWFMCESLIKSIRGLKSKHLVTPHVIGIFKSNYTFELGTKKTKKNQKSLLAAKKRKASNSKVYKCQYLIVKNATYKGIPVTLFIVCMNGTNTWTTLATTDKKLSFKKAMEYYKARWTIEVFFKDVKQNLNFGKNQSQDFDSQIAHTTIVCIQYLALILSKQLDDYRSIGALFDYAKDKLIQQNIIEKIWNLVFAIYDYFIAPYGMEPDRFIAGLIEGKIVSNFKKTTALLLSSETNLLSLSENTWET